jgi:2-polyprenyl-6-methoxyphenol hydroxylase-like FAD-dependent oxidoreductase
MTPTYPSKAVDVTIVGAGPVGLTASLLLSRFHVHHWVIEQLLEPTDHPQAHFIGCGSMEIFRELNDLVRTLQKKFNPLNTMILSADGHPLAGTVFALTEDTPSFLPPRFAVLVRPEAHVARMETE